MKKYSIRVWKILDDKSKQLMELQETDSEYFKNKIFDLFKDMYLCYCNLIIEVKNNETNVSEKYGDLIDLKIDL